MKCVIKNNTNEQTLSHNDILAKLLRQDVKRSCLATLDEMTRQKLTARVENATIVKMDV